MNRTITKFITPKRELCVDATLVASRGYSVMRKYISSEKAKCGWTFWLLCEAASGCILQMERYRGRQFDPVPPGQRQGTLVVTRLVEAASLLNKGYHVFCDRVYSSLNLAQRLFASAYFYNRYLKNNNIYILIYVFVVSTFMKKRPYWALYMYITNTKNTTITESG